MRSARGFRRAWFGLPRIFWIVTLAIVSCGVVAAVAFDAAVDAVSARSADLVGRVAACGRRGERIHPLSRRVTVDLDDGRRVVVHRIVNGRPECGGRVRIEKRLTPWGTMYYLLDASLGI